MSIKPSPETAPRTNPLCTTRCSSGHCESHPLENQYPVSQGSTIRTRPNSMQNSTYTTANTRCSHTGSSAAWPSAGWGAGAGGGLSKLVEVSFKNLGIFVLFIVLDAIEDFTISAP